MKKKKKKEREETSVQTSLTACAHSFLLVTTPVGLMHGIALTANCDLFLSTMALSLCAVAVTGQRHNTAARPTQSPEVSSFGRAGFCFDVRLSQLWSLMFMLDFILLLNCNWDGTQDPQSLPMSHRATCISVSPRPYRCMLTPS